MPVEHITQSILVLRGHKVLLDTELAALYGVATKVLLQALKRSRERFPDDFMIQLTAAEWAALRSQFVTSKPERGGRRSLPGHHRTSNSNQVRSNRQWFAGRFAGSSRLAGESFAVTICDRKQFPCCVPLKPGGGGPAPMMGKLAGPRIARQRRGGRFRMELPLKAQRSLLSPAPAGARR